MVFDDHRERSEGPRWGKSGVIYGGSNAHRRSIFLIYFIFYFLF